jgi:hypothetical protein
LLVKLCTQDCWTLVSAYVIRGVPLASKPSISLIILTPMKILQRNLNRRTFVVWEMKRNVSVVCFKFRCNILISGKIIKEMLSSVASGTHCIRRGVTAILPKQKISYFTEFAANWPATYTAYKFSSNKVRLRSSKCLVWGQN